MKDIFNIAPKNDNKLSDQEQMFFEIWRDREHKSEVSGIELPYNFNPSMYFVFSHVHSKGACPRLKLEKKYIVLMTLREHQLWEGERHKIADDPKWYPVFQLLEEAKSECDQL